MMKNGDKNHAHFESLAHFIIVSRNVKLGQQFVTFFTYLRNVKTRISLKKKSENCPQ